MSLLIIPGKFSPEVWVKALHQLDPDLKIDIWPQALDYNAIQFAMVWTYPPGELLKYPNLKCISSLGAGVDHILQDPQRPPHVPIVRVVDPYLIRDMTHYVIWAVINYARHLDYYVQSQARHLWTPRTFSAPPQVGVMGLGKLGADVAQKLHHLGFPVNGWSRSPKIISGVTCYAGEEQRTTFLNNTDILVCLLPLTSQTRHILNRETFAQLRKKAYIINVGRGQHLVDADLLAALDEGILSGACLDVFNTEPLPADHPFWRYTMIRVTPHISSVTNADSAAQQILDNYRRAMSGQPLINLVDVEKEY